MTGIDQLAKWQYLNLETFRKNGVGVRTPVWFVQEGDTVFVRTVANSGKVKRIRNSGRVAIAPCKIDGTLLGEWFPAQAREVTDKDTSQQVDHLLNRKYGLMKKMITLFSSLQRRQETILEVKVREEA
jgi:PPOX class probable F420-dependent enzyme